MLPSQVRAKTAQAAEIAGIGYEGFRSWLKRGLLKTTGPLMPKSYAAHVPAEVTDSKRWQWSEFGFADLCAFRLVRVLLDAGLPWETASDIASANIIWELQREAQKDEDEPLDIFGKDKSSPTRATLLAIHRLKEQNEVGSMYYWCVYKDYELMDDIRRDIVTTEHMTLVDLENLRREVVSSIMALGEAGRSRKVAETVSQV